MIVQEYIDADAEERRRAKEEILAIANKHMLRAPASVKNHDLYSFIFEGLTIGRLQPWLSDDRKYNTALSPDRLYMVRQFAESAPKGGKHYECGVYTGGVTRMLLDMGKDVVAFDTFEGINGVGEFDLHLNGDYNGGDVSEYIFGAEIVKGFVPDTFDGRDDKISFAHLDMDIYFPTKAALEHIYPRLLDGGIIVLDDYGFWTTPGIKKAVDEFPFGRKIYLPTGQMVILK